MDTQTNKGDSILRDTIIKVFSVSDDVDGWLEKMERNAGKHGYTNKINCTQDK